MTGDNRLFINDGYGYFEDDTLAFNRGTNHTIATDGFEADFADIDWDQDLDLVVARWQPNPPDANDDIFLNLYSQLFIWPKSPELGQTINMVQCGFEDDIYEIRASQDIIYNEDGVHGWLRLDTSNDFLVVCDTLGASQLPER